MNDQDGANPATIDMLLGHARGGVEGIYNRAQLIEQRRAALRSWQTLLARHGVFK